MLAERVVGGAAGKRFLVQEGVAEAHAYGIEHAPRLGRNLRADVVARQHGDVEGAHAVEPHVCNKRRSIRAAPIMLTELDVMADASGWYGARWHEPACEIGGDFVFKHAPF